MVFWLLSLYFLFRFAMPGFFITGTDTEIGKTFVSSLLIKILVDEGLKVSGMKPVASDAKNIDGVLQNEDALTLMQAANVDADYSLVNPYVFAEAVSPHIAAEDAGVEIDLNKIKNNLDVLEKKSDVVVVEGVGGWYAPLSYDTTVADLARVLNTPVIIVVGLRLGCLNHALLTVQAIRHSGVPIAGWMANHVEEHFSSAEKNIETLKAFLSDVPFLGSVSYNKNSTHSSFEYHVNKHLLIDSLRIKK